MSAQWSYSQRTRSSRVLGISAAGTRHHFAVMCALTGSLRQTSPHGDELVEPGVRDEDDVGGRAGLDGGDGAVRAGREQVVHVAGPARLAGQALLLKPPDGEAAAAGG
ncbi:hypothetical protein GCM10020001_022240 [Nonomuraea salmonea]